MQEEIGVILEKEMDIFLNGIDNSEIRKLLSYYFNLGGKRLRPTLFFALSKNFNSKEALAPYSLVLELIHTMSLYHDDIIDNANERRGAPTVHKKWDMPTALVAGDIFHGMIHQYLVKCIMDNKIDRNLGLRFFSDLILEVELHIGTGVIEEMQMALDKEMPPLNAGLRVCRSKTAPLFSFSASAAAYLAGMDDETCKKMYLMGDSLGFAFQLIDDISDYFPSNKGWGNDLREDRKTPILILCDAIDREQTTHYRLIGRKLEDKQIISFRNEFKEQFLEVFRMAEESIDKSMDVIKDLENNMYKENVKTIVDVLKLQMNKYKSKLA